MRRVNQCTRCGSNLELQGYRVIQVFLLALERHSRLCFLVCRGCLGFQGFQECPCRQFLGQKSGGQIVSMTNRVGGLR